MFGFHKLTLVTRSQASRHQRAISDFVQVSLEQLEECTLLTAGDLDVSFGNAGQVITEFEDSTAWSKVALATVAQADGKITAAGEGALARYLPDGSLDITFGVGGKAAFPYYSRALAVQTDGRIIVVGGTESISSQDFVVARYLSNGTLDTSFDGDGIALTDFGANETAFDVAIQPNGQIVVVGGSGDDIAVARYGINGVLDTTFDADGRFRKRFNNNRTDTAYSVALQANGGIVVAGKTWVSYSFNSSNHDFFVMRLNTNGTPDSSFDTDGYCNTDFGKYDEARDLLIQPDGRIVVSGLARINYNEYLAVARYNADGSLDTTFDQDGTLQLRVPGSLTDNSTGAAVALQSDGKILTSTSGYVYRFNVNGVLDPGFNGTGRTEYRAVVKTLLVQPNGRLIEGGFNSGVFSLTRFTAAGLRDLTFSGDGVVHTEFGPSIDEAGGSTLQSDGKLIVVGKSQRGFSVARYNSNGSPDLTFSSDGRTVISFSDEYFEAGAADVAIQADGKIVIVGSATKIISQSVHSEFTVVRLKPDGSLDTTFSGDGITTAKIGASSGAKTVAIQPNGRIVIGGFGAGGYFSVARFLTDGSLDKSFRGTGFATHFIDSNFTSSVTGIVVQPDGKILAVGNIENFSTGRYRSTVAMVRYNPNGTLDTGFVNGRDSDHYNPLRVANDVELLSDGSILVAGNAEYYDANGRSSSMAVTKYNRDGSLSTFGTVVFPFQKPIVFDPLSSYTAVSVARSLVVLPNGKITVGGDAEGSFTIWRLNADGTHDTSFGGDGRVSTTFAGGTASLVDLVRQPNGMLIAVGSLKAPINAKYSDSDFIMTRYTEGSESAFSASVGLNSFGQVEVRDLWSRDDQLDIRREGNSVILTDLTNDSHAKFQVTGVPGAAGHGTKQVTMPVSTIIATSQPLLVNSLAGDDFVTFASESDVAPMQGVAFRGGLGDDTLSQAGSAISAVWRLSTTGGGYVISTGRAPRTFSNVEKLLAGVANDDFIVKATSTPVVSMLRAGNGGIDSLSVSADADMTISNSELRITGAINQRMVIGGFEKASLTGGASSNRLNTSAFDGAASLSGLQGNDELTGGRHNDLLSGGDGDDVLFGDFGNDSLDGGTGNDLLVGDYGDDLIHGRDGHDILVGGFGADRLSGGSGEDILIGGLSSLFYVNAVPADRNAVVSAWASADSYSAKVARLSVTGIPGVNGTLKLIPPSTVFDDISVDTMNGESGLDWFFASGSLNFNEAGIGQGGVRDLALDEILTWLI